MKKEIVSIDSKQGAKVVAIISVIFSLIFSVIGLVMLIIGLISKQTNMMYYSITYIIMPVLYLIIVYPTLRLFYWLYNRVASRWGGILVELEDKK
ncbi:MAG: hypothetical protein KAH15_04360 [Candidatus Marinimicrobia bacterium]|nr:hypothetical protein [Candidatus Neomarinimicrobiota bacterium]